MINAHIFLVILVTAILIIFAEHQKLRNISWILFIGCVTYILLMLEPENTQITNTGYDELTTIDSSYLSEEKNYLMENDNIDNVTATVVKVVDTMTSKKADINNDIQSLEIVTLAIATDVVEKTPLGVSRLFLNDINALYCFTVVDNTLKNNKIIHNWKRCEDDYTYEQNYFKNFIEVGDSPNWRCWSRITIRPEMTGDWKVVVTDIIGNQLDSIEFSIIPTSE